MSLSIYNSMSHKKEPFTPSVDAKVKMYVCGPTVYDFLHVGNFRGAIFFNLVRNWLEFRGYEVTFVYNYTDVDDKIIHRANADGVPAMDIANRYIAEFEKDFHALQLRPHSRNPRVTEFMAQIIDFVDELVQADKAYVAEGDVFYDVRKFPQYGRLSHKNLEDLEAGVRIEVDSRKKHPSDFALWKKSKAGEPHWPSPWGDGRPGWHIECSAMARGLLGDSIDIHGGGLDLIFPHHENEIAQSEGVTGKPFARYWMHNNMLNFGSQKMSKSLGNVRSARSFLEEYNAEIFKYLMLSAHYRSVLDFTPSQIDHVISALARVYSAMALAARTLENSKLDAVSGSVRASPSPSPSRSASATSTSTANSPQFAKLIEEAREGVGLSLDDDFNTPEVLARNFDVIRAFNSVVRTPGPVTPMKVSVSETFLEWTAWLGGLMSLFKESPAGFLKTLDDMLLKKENLDRSQIDQLVNERARARAAKDFKRADELRDQLAGMGIQVQDQVQGSEWEVAK